MDMTSIVDRLLLMSLRGTIFLGNLAETELRGRQIIMGLDIGRASLNDPHKSPYTITARSTLLTDQIQLDGEMTWPKVFTANSEGHSRSRLCTESKKASALFTSSEQIWESFPAGWGTPGIISRTITRFKSMIRGRPMERIALMRSPMEWPENMPSDEEFEFSTPGSVDISRLTNE